MRNILSRIAALPPVAVVVSPVFPDSFASRLRELVYTDSTATGRYIPSSLYLYFRLAQLYEAPRVTAFPSLESLYVSRFPSFR